ncbi:unnamed protein product [Moneuplotes crassus]|uniref:Uncharacterized protein n=1 Tax=Euplotes crassus TaxID=5936 RepID=A0AAD1XGF0_EUPCR|nr:unnamed protein product [Moneuplotes crassus]
MSFSKPKEDLLENYISSCSPQRNIASIDTNNESSTYFKTEERFSYHGNYQNFTTELNEVVPHDELSMSFNNFELPMFSFPPNQKYPFNFEEDREILMNQGSSFYKFNANEAKKSNLTYADASNESFEETESHKTCSKSQNISEITDKPIESKPNDNLEELLNGLTSVPHYKDHRFSTRRDVINKTIFRIMKRFFVMKFKEAFPKMKLKSTSLKEFTDASDSFLSSVEELAPIRSQLKYFIVQMLSTKLASNFEVSEELKESLKLLDTCLYSYSDKALRKIFSDSLSTSLFNYFFKYGQKFYKDQKNVKKNEVEYVKMLNNLHMSFNSSISI